MAGKAKSIAILQFDERSLSVLRLRRSPKGLELLEFIQQKGEWSAEDGSVQRALAEIAPAIAKDDVYTVLPRYELTGRILDLPSLDPEELEGMVRLSAEEYVPYPIDELAIDFCILDEVIEGHSRVLAAFAHKDVVEAHMQMLAEVGIVPVSVFLSSSCMAAAAVAARGNNEERYAIIELGGAGLETIIIDGQQVQHSRAVATLQDWSMTGPGAAEASEELIVEARSSLSAYLRESMDGQGVETVYLSSPIADVKQACEALAAAVDYECRPARFCLAPVMKGVEEIKHLPLSLLGAALEAQGRGGFDIDLLPESVTKGRARAEAARTAIKFGVLIFLVLASVVGWYSQKVHQRMEYIREREVKNSELMEYVAGVSEKQTQLRILQQQVSRMDTALEVLARVCDQAPNSGLNLTRFRYIRDSKITLNGRARTKDVVDRLTNDLRTLDQFAAAVIVYTKDMRERKKTVQGFEVNIPFPELEEDDAAGRR